MARMHGDRLLFDHFCTLPHSWPSFAAKGPCFCGGNSCQEPSGSIESRGLNARWEGKILLHRKPHLSFPSSFSSSSSLTNTIKSWIQSSPEVSTDSLSSSPIQIFHIPSRAQRLAQPQTPFSYLHLKINPSHNLRRC